MASAQGRLWIGTSGYQYDHWRSRFYPEDLPKKRWFEHYARRFDSVEINSSFYRLPEIQTFETWRQQAPTGFLYALKFSRYGTHIKRLREPEETIGRFVERARHLRDHLGPVLVQLPPRFGFNSRCEDSLSTTAPLAIVGGTVLF